MPSRRRGHTLVELMMVLMILVLFAVIAIPRFISSMYHRQLDAAFEATLSDLNYAHARASSTGLRHQFLLDPDDLSITVQPFHPELADTTVAQTAGSGTNQDLRPSLQDKLPEGVKVVEWTVSPLGYDQGAASARGNSQADALTFYPEGRGDSARLVLQDQDGSQRGLIVDGYTGAIRELSPEEMNR